MACHRLFNMKNILLRTAFLFLGLGLSMAPAQTNVAPSVVIAHAAMRPGTTFMEVLFRVEDPDDTTVKVRALAFKDGVRSFANIIRPVTFVEGTADKIGDAIPANANHALTWNVGADWNIDLGQAKFEILAMDGRGLLSFDWITIPAVGPYPQTTVSTNTPTSTEVMNALYWQFASGDPGLTLTNATLYGNSNSVEFNGVDLASGASMTPWATPFIFKRMNLAVAEIRDLSPLITARAGALASGWLAADRPYSGCIPKMSARASEYYQIPSATVAALTGFTDIAFGQNYGLALMSDGTVIGFGNGNNYGQKTIPAGLSRVIAIAASFETSFALKNDGTLVAWGRNDYGLLSFPGGLNGVIAIAPGYTHALALKGDGTVVGWGVNDHGQATPPADLTGVTAIAAGNGHSLALRSNGVVVAWGMNNYGEATVPSGLTGVTAIAACGEHSLALKGDGTVVGWGSNSQGQNDVPTGLTGVVAIAAGLYHGLALKNDGTAVGWGGNQYGQASWPTGLTNILAIRAGLFNSAVLMTNSP